MLDISGSIVQHALQFAIEDWHRWKKQLDVPVTYFAQSDKRNFKQLSTSRFVWKKNFRRLCGLASLFGMDKTMCHEMLTATVNNYFA